MIKKYDLLIIGGGLSGLSTAYELANSKITIGLIEESTRLGGRIRTATHELPSGNNISFEAGAGRFSETHRRVLKLIKKFGLADLIGENGNQVKFLHSKIGDDDSYQYLKGQCDRNRQPCVYPLIETAIQRFLNVEGSEEMIYHFSLDQICQKYLPEREYQWVKFAYPYDAKFQIGNAKTVEYTAKIHYTSKFFHLKGGLSQLISLISERITPEVDVMLTTKCLSVDKITTGDHEIYYRLEVVKYNQPITIYTKNLVAAVPPKALNNIRWNCLSLENLHWIDSYSLYRIYAVYPKNSQGKMWFQDLPRVITDNPIRYIIPINPKKGIIMISYQGGELANLTYQEMLDSNDPGYLKSLISHNLAKLFPGREIPSPSYLQGFYWDIGVHVYRPGIDPSQQFHQWTRPSPDPLWITGEAYSEYQGWMEGSLQSSHAAVKQIKARLFLLKERNKMGLDTRDRDKDGPGDRVSHDITGIIPSKIPSNLPSYSLKQVKKHNKRHDAWIALFGYVYDVTDWISIHPGGDAILNGIGKEYSQEWSQISAHQNKDDQMSKILAKYLIGKLSD